jgi:PAS domain S-box-containing protein
MKKSGKLNSGEYVSFKITIIYASFSALWILLSDQILYFMVKAPEIMTKIQMIKGWVFVLTSALIIFFLLKKEIRKHIQVEEALKESESRHNKMVANIGDVIAIIDRDGVNRYKSANIEKLFGWKPEDVVGVSTWKNIHPDDLEFMQQFFGKLMSEPDAPGATECRYKCKDGSYRWIEFTGTNLLHDPDINGFLGNYHDITNRKQSENLLKQSLSLLNATQQLAKIGGFEIDLEKKITFWTDEVYRIHDLQLDRFKSIDEALKLSVECYDPEDRQVIIEAFRKCLEEGQAYDLEFPFNTGKGRRIWIRTKTNPILEDGKVIKVVGSFMDITERKQADELLKEKTKFLDQIIETSALSMWISDEKGTAIKTNPACRELFGATEEEVVGKYNLFKDSVIEKKGFMPVVKGVFKKGRPASFVIDYNFGAVNHVNVKNATHKTIKTVLTPVLDSDKKVSNVIVQAIDLTEIKQSEEEKIKINKILADHEKLSLVGQVAGKMAHDFNNVLGIIMGNTELSILDCKDDQTKKTLELIYEQTIRGKNLTKNLVAFAKDQEPKQEFFSIHEKIDIVTNLLQKDLEGIELIKENKPGLPDLLADPGMIEHALVNLIQNSIHAISKVEHPKITMRTYCLEDEICFEIEDNGCGIPKEYMESIFEPSFTLKGNKDVTGSYESNIRGTGYGMSNVKKYIELHMGTILSESKMGSGTKFTIRLPVIKKELSKEEKIEIRKEITYFEKYILLVEDEIAISDIQYNVLTQEPGNHKVDTANNGKAAMDLFDRNEYDFISLDFILPGKINGMDLYNHIRETNKTIPILFISGNIEFLESIKNLKQKDANIDHLSKPCPNKEYLRSINKLIEKSITPQ